MIQEFADRLVYGLLGLSADTPIGIAVNFFFYDTIKILILLFFISVLMGIINAYFPIERLRKYLVTHNMYGLQYLLASIFGAVTPFCSCSSIPLFIGFVKGGIPLGVTFAFLITSPLVNEVAVAMFLGSFGLKVTLIYVISGILLGVIGGIVLGYIWQLIFNGILAMYNQAITASEWYGFWGLIILVSWQQIGYMMIIYIAGLQSIPEDVMEAAQIDGASSIRRLFSITIPMMMPSITICTFLSVTNGFKLFDQNLSLTAGEPSKMSEML